MGGIIQPRLRREVPGNKLFYLNATSWHLGQVRSSFSALLWDCMLTSDTEVHSLDVKLSFHHKCWMEEGGGCLLTCWAFKLTAKWAVTKQQGGWSEWRTILSTHTVAVLPLEQFVLNAFEKAPSRNKTRDRPWRGGGGRKTIKAQGQVKRIPRTDVSSCSRWGTVSSCRQRLASVRDSEEHP